ncbi:MAG: VOC family protein, partial [Bacteroidota bacterium]
MKSHIAIFEIPVNDITRAIHFYEKLLDINIEKFEMPGMEMALFPYQDQLVTGVLLKSEGYIPRADGIT